MTGAEAAPDALLGGRLRLHQPPRGAHRAGTDAVLLAALIVAPEGGSLCDVGASTGAVGLMAAVLAPGLRVTLVEREPELAELARRNARLNRLDARVIAADVLAPGVERRAAGLLPDVHDVVLTNPPFLGPGAHRPSPDPGRAAAHGFGQAGDLDRWIRTCTAILRPGGHLGLIHRTDALPACLAALDRRCGGIAVRPVHPRAGTPAIRVLIRAVRGSRAPLLILPPLVLMGADGRFTPEAEALHHGLPWPGPTSSSPARA